MRIETNSAINALCGGQFSRKRAAMDPPAGRALFKYRLIIQFHLLQYQLHSNLCSPLQQGQNQQILVTGIARLGKSENTRVRGRGGSLVHNAQTAGRAWGTWLIRILAMAWCIGPSGASAENAAIEIGIIPTLSTRTILATYQPVREYLEAKMQRPVVLTTAPDYRTFIDRTQHGEYHFVITAPHFARLAQLEAGYVPMVRVKRELRGILVVRTDSVINTVNDLRGKIVSTPENIAVVTMLGQQLLRRHGLEPGKTITVRPSASFNSAVLAVQNGESDAAFTAQTALNQMSAETRSLLRTIASTDAVPHNILLASKQVPPKEVDRMTRLLLEFTKDKSRGIPFFEQTGFLGYVRPTTAELKVLDPYVTELKRQLAASETPPNRKP